MVTIEHAFPVIEAPKAFSIPTPTEADDLEWYFTWSDGELAGFTSPLAQMQQAALEGGCSRAEPGDVRLLHCERPSTMAAAERDRRIRRAVGKLTPQEQLALQAHYRDHRRQASALRVHYKEFAGLVAWQSGSVSGPRIATNDKRAPERRAQALIAARAEFSAASAAYRASVKELKR